MGAVATFDWPTFSTRYPEFVSIGSATASSYFTEATLYHSNDGSGPVADPGQQLLLMNMMTAHLAQIYSGVGGQPPSPLTGPISSASEGSVSVSVDVSSKSDVEQWLKQTKYGFAYWRATSIYRRFQFRTPPSRIFDPWSGGFC